MPPRPVPGPWLRLPPAFMPRYVTAAETVVFTAACDCGSGLDVEWLASRDQGEKPLTCACTCNTMEGAA